MASLEMLQMRLIFNRRVGGEIDLRGLACNLSNIEVCTVLFNCKLYDIELKSHGSDWKIL